MKTFQIPIIILALAAILGVYFGYDTYQQQIAAEVALNQVNDEIRGKEQQIALLEAKRRQLLTENSEYYQFRDRWKKHYVADTPEAGSALIGQWDNAARQDYGLATANRSSDDGPLMDMPASGNRIQAKAIAIQASGSYADILNFIGWVETTYPFGRWDRIRLTAAADRVLGDFRMLIPVSVEPPDDRRRR